jgi:hypothetical protein
MEQKLETHQEALDRLQLQVGDKVKVLEKAESYKRGWGTGWVHGTMDEAIGKIGVVKGIDTVVVHNHGIALEIEGISGSVDNVYYYPAYVLEVVERAKDAVTTTAKAPTVLQEAESLIYGDREKDYGKTSDNFADIAKGWEVIAKTTITPEQVGLMMAWLKICRANKDNCEKRDSLVDLCGYAGCIEKIKKGL